MKVISKDRCLATLCHSFGHILLLSENRMMHTCQRVSCTSRVQGRPERINDIAAQSGSSVHHFSSLHQIAPVQQVGEEYACVKILILRLQAASNIHAEVIDRRKDGEDGIQRPLDNNGPVRASCASVPGCVRVPPQLSPASPAHTIYTHASTSGQDYLICLF